MNLLHKKEKQNKNNDQLIRLMLPMIAGILACIFCLVSMTWAWFKASVNTGTQTIQAATQFTKVKVYEVVKSEDGNKAETRTLVKPSEDSKTALKEVSIIEELQTDKEISVVTAEEPLVWELLPEKRYEIVMTGGGTASQGYCKVALSHTENGAKTSKTELYQTSAFEKETNVTFTYNTGGFSKTEGVTATEWKEYVEKTTPPTLTIASYWGEPKKNETSQVALMSLRGDAEEKIMLLSNGDVLGLAPIPCPEAKAEIEVELEGFEAEEGSVISAEEDYKVSLTLKEGFEMPSEVVVNIDGKDYVVSTQGAEVSDDAPYYDAESGILTVPSSLLSDGVKVSVKATATQIPAEEPEEEKTEEEATDGITEETIDNNETEDSKSADTPSGNDFVADNPTKKEEDGEKDSVKPNKTPAGNGGNDNDNDETDKDQEVSSSGNASSPENNEENTEDEKADVTLNLSQLTINLEETQIPTNADLVLTLSAKEDKKLPEQIVITLDKTIHDENIDDEKIKEDKTEYIINTDGKDNPKGIEFDAESGELTISSKLLEGVREITIADTENDKANKDEEKATITFEVKNLTFDFTDDEIAHDEDVVITFTAGEGYKLPETIVITIDGEKYIIYTSEKDSDKNPDGITFDAKTGTLTISKDLLEDVKAITIAAEGIEKEEEKENPDTNKKEESEDKDITDKENGTEGGETTDKETQGGTNAPDTEEKTETEGKTEVEGGENTETANPDNTTEGKEDGETGTVEPGTQPTNPNTPDTENNTNTEQGGENVETEENGKGSTDDGSEEITKPVPDTESGCDNETSGESGKPTTETTTPEEPSEPAVTPETPKAETPSIDESAKDGNDSDDNGGTDNTDGSSGENDNNSGNNTTENTASSESANSSSPSVTPSAPAISETNTHSSGNTSSTSVSDISTPSTNSNPNGENKTSDTTISSESNETSSEE